MKILIAVSLFITISAFSHLQYSFTGLPRDSLNTVTDSTSDKIKTNNSMDMISLDNFEVITGTWETEGDEIYHEEWKRNADGSYSGKAYNIAGGEESNTEYLTLHFKNGNIYYTADVSHNPAPVDFRLVEFTGSKAVFENPDHNFPRRITYNFEDNKITAVIEGPGKDGRTRQFGFSMKRISD